MGSQAWMVKEQFVFSFSSEKETEIQFHIIAFFRRMLYLDRVIYILSFWNVYAFNLECFIVHFRFLHHLACVFTWHFPCVYVSMGAIVQRWQCWCNMGWTSWLWKSAMVKTRPFSNNTSEYSIYRSNYISWNYSMWNYMDCMLQVYFAWCNASNNHSG